jgi:hypothetical protein
MAKRRKKVGRVKHHRRRKIGATGKGAFELLLGGVAGAVVGRLAYTTFTTLPQYVLQAAELVGGGAAAAFGGGNPLVTGLGLGLVAEGTAQIMQMTIPAVNGIDLSTQYNPQKHISGYRDVPKVGDFPKPAAVGRYEKMMHGAYKGVY